MAIFIFPMTLREYFDLTPLLAHSSTCLCRSVLPDYQGRLVWPLDHQMEIFIWLMSVDLLFSLACRSDGTVASQVRQSARASLQAARTSIILPISHSDPMEVSTSLMILVIASFGSTARLVRPFLQQATQARSLFLLEALVSSDQHTSFSDQTAIFW